MLSVNRLGKKGEEYTRGEDVRAPSLYAFLPPGVLLTLIFRPIPAATGGLCASLVVVPCVCSCPCHHGGPGGREGPPGNHLRPTRRAYPSDRPGLSDHRLPQLGQAVIMPPDHLAGHWLDQPYFRLYQYAGAVSYQL